MIKKFVNLTHMHVFNIKRWEQEVMVDSIFDIVSLLYGKVKYITQRALEGAMVSVVNCKIPLNTII